MNGISRGFPKVVRFAGFAPTATRSKSNGSRHDPDTARYRKQHTNDSARARRSHTSCFFRLRAGLGFSRAYLLGRRCSGSPQLASRRQRAVLACSVRARLIAGPGCRKTLTLGLGQLDEPNTRKGSIALSIKAVAIQAELVIAGLCFHARGTPSNITNQSTSTDALCCSFVFFYNTHEGTIRRPCARIGL